MFLGFGLKSNSTLNLVDHLELRDDLRSKEEHTRKVKRLRYVFKGDVAIVRDLFNMFFVARFYYGVNRIMTALDENAHYYDGLTADNWTQRDEPKFAEKLNKGLINTLAWLMPGNANKFLAAAMLGIKPLHVKHLQLKPEDVRDYWLGRSESRVKHYMLHHWDNIQNCLRNRSTV